MKQLKKELLDLLLVSTVHGLPNVARSKRTIHKIMWTIGFAFFFGSMCYSVNEAISNFLKYQAVTEVQTVYEQPAQFPTISFCSIEQNFFEKNNLTSILEKNKLKCSFNYDKSCQNNSNAYFESYESPSYGRCFRFNSGRNMSGHSIPLLYSTIGGRDDSFSLQVEAPQGLAY